MTLDGFGAFIIYGGPIVLFVALFLGIPVFGLVLDPLRERDSRSRKERLRDIHID